MASRVGEELRWQLDTLRQHKEEQIILKGTKIRNGESSDSLQKLVRETINDIDEKSENVEKIERYETYIM